MINTKKNILPFATMTEEDFYEFANRIPGAFYFHHNPCFNIDEDSLTIDVEMHVRTALSFLGY